MSPSRLVPRAPFRPLTPGAPLPPPAPPPRPGARARGDAGVKRPPGGVAWEEHAKAAPRQALELSGGNRARAARLLDLPYKAFLYRLEKFGLAPAEE